MTDVTTKEPLRVTDDVAGPYLLLPFEQLDDLQRLLDSRGVRYTVEEDIISWDGGPEIAAVDFSAARMPPPCRQSWIVPVKIKQRFPWCLPMIFEAYRTAC